MIEKCSVSRRHLGVERYCDEEDDDMDNDRGLRRHDRVLQEYQERGDREVE